MQTGSSWVRTWSVRIRATLSAALRSCGPGCGSGPPRFGGGRSFWRWSPRFRLSRCAATWRRDCANGESGASMRSCSRRVGSTGWASGRRSGCASRPTGCFPRRGRGGRAGQGALALQVRTGEEELVAAADDPETRRRVEAERACVFAIGGGCLAPIAAHHDGTTLTALVADEDGAWIERRSGDDPAALAAELMALAQN